MEYGVVYNATGSLKGHEPGPMLFSESIIANDMESGELLWFESSWIQDSRARNHYDEMFFLVLLGAALVLIGDLLSALARETIRRFS